MKMAFTRLAMMCQTVALYLRQRSAAPRMASQQTILMHTCVVVTQTAWSLLTTRIPTSLLSQTGSDMSLMVFETKPSSGSKHSPSVAFSLSPVCRTSLSTQLRSVRQMLGSLLLASPCCRASPPSRKCWTRLIAITTRLLSMSPHHFGTHTSMANR